MDLTNLKAVLAATVLLGAGAAGVGMAQAPPDKKAAAPADLYGDALPPGFIARFGTVQRRCGAASLAISPDGKTLITAEQGIVREWDAATGAAGAVHRLPGPAPVQTFLSSDGKTVAVRGADGLTLWDAAKGERLAKLPFDEVCMITQAVFAPDGRTLATAEYAGAGGPIRLWNVADGKGRLLAKHGGAVTALAFAPDGKRIAASSAQNGMLLCWDAADGKEVWRTKAATYQLAFATDGRTLVSADDSSDAPLHLWDAATGLPVQRGRLPAGRVGSIWFGPDGNTLAISTTDGVLLWDLKAGKEQRRLTGANGPLLFSPDGKTLTGFVVQSLQRWDLASGKALYPDARPQGHLAPVEAVAYSADGKLLASIAFDKSIRIWDVASCKALHILSGPSRNGWTWAAFTPDGATLVTVGDDTVRFWDVREGKEIRRLDPHDLGADRSNSQLQSFHLAIDGKTLVTVLPDPDPTGQVAIFGMGGTGTLTVLDAATGKQQTRRSVPNPRHSDVVSADGRWMAVEDGAVFDTATGDRRLTLKADHGIGVPFGDAFAFSPDGALVAGVLWENVMDGPGGRTESRGIQVWELATGAPVARIPVKEFCRFAFAPDGRTLATVEPDTVRLWDAVSARELCHQSVADHLLGPYGSAFAFAPDGRSLAVGATDSTVLVWDLSPAYAQAPAAPPLSTAEADDLWTDLAGADAAKAHCAVQRLAVRPAEAMPLLRERLRAVPPVPSEQLKHWLANLDDDDFSVREEATRRLADLNGQANSALRETLKGEISPEQRRRITALLEAARVMSPDDALRGVRAVRVLERIDSPACRLVLKTLAEGDPAAAVTQEAKEALTRGAAHE